MDIKSLGKGLSEMNYEEGISLILRNRSEREERAVEKATRSKAVSKVKPKQSIESLAKKLTSKEAEELLKLLQKED